jgi:bacteriorhodopsin
MSEQVTTESKDYFWAYVVAAMLALVAVIVMVKLSENEKYDPIRQQLSEEAAQMNIRVLN